MRIILILEIIIEERNGEECVFHHYLVICKIYIVKISDFFNYCIFIIELKIITIYQGYNKCSYQIQDHIH